MKIIKRGKTKSGQEYVVVGGIEKTTLINDIAKKYSKNYYLPFSPFNYEEGTIFLIKRKKPLYKPVESFYAWEKGVTH